MKGYWVLEFAYRPELDNYVSEGSATIKATTKREALKEAKQAWEFVKKKFPNPRNPILANRFELVP